MKTHRCEESLAAKISIRYEEKTSAWWLFKPTHDLDWDTYYLSVISKIQYCPFCGEKLEMRP